MNSLTKIRVVLSFPLGAMFHQNIYDYVYKHLLKMIYRLSCINIDGKCRDCLLKDKCQYYKITGENYTKYPGIIIHKDIFVKSIYRNNEEIIFEFYLIGNCRTYKSYIEIYFQEYLDYQICGHYFQIKSINSKTINNELINIDSLNISTTIENNTFNEIYNNMFEYYNDNYQCDYSLLNNHIDILDIKQSRLNTINLSTKRIVPSGITAKIKTNLIINSHLLLIGLGKYNYIGGGHIETQNNLRER